MSPDNLSSKSPDHGKPDYFNRLYLSFLEEGRSLSDALQATFEAYLDGKPKAVGKLKSTRHERDRWFWNSRAVDACGNEDWCTEAGTLALSRYLSQDRLFVDGLLENLARKAPKALVVAMRRARLVLTPDSQHLRTLRSTSALSVAVEEQLRIHDALVSAHRERQRELTRRQSALADTTAFELLVLASLHAHKMLLPHRMAGKSFVEEHGGRLDDHWDAITDLLLWRLKTAPLETLKLNDERIGYSLKRYLSPLLFPEREPPTKLLNRMRAFAELLAAQIELNEFLSRSVDAHCFNDSVRFIPLGDGRLDLVETDPGTNAKWQRDGRKLELLHGYWLHRAFHDFAASDMAHARIGRPENEDENRVAYIRAMAIRLRLREVYGLEDEVTSPTGESTDLFQALLSLELTARFFFLNFIVPFVVGAERTGDWIVSLQQLALGGLRNGMQNRFPLTWSNRDAKIANTTGWTVTPSQPDGSARMAAAIVDFWAHDMLAEAERLRDDDPGIAPRLIERPYLKFGDQLVQLPWVVARQNNSTAAINNLRRLAARRPEARDETRRIESHLAGLLRGRGFQVLLNWQPPAQRHEAGEVDVIAARDRSLFILEVKSTFIRRSLQEAWLHASTTLPKAGKQLRRKVETVELALATDESMRDALGLSHAHPPKLVHGWIVDTSIESDHERFGGFLKVSLEEVIVALRDDRSLLGDPVGLVSGQPPSESSLGENPAMATLYPSGFDAARFAAVIENELVWEIIGLPKHG